VRRLLPTVAIALGLMIFQPPAAAGKVVPGRYIVTLKEGNSPRTFARGNGIRPRRVFKAILNGFSAQLTPRKLRALKRNKRVIRVSRVHTVEVDTIQNMNSSGQPWGLDRIDQRALPLSRTYDYQRTGLNVNVYVVDTGLTAHTEFGNRVRAAYDAYPGTGTECNQQGSQMNGHGTKVAGVIGATTWGVAKRSILHRVKVFRGGTNCSGNSDDLIDGLDWVRTHFVRPAVVNMSLSSARNAEINAAARGLVAAGLFVAAAAGNQNTSAYNRSPASTSELLTVAASDQTDARWPSSNYGAYVDLYAPGANIRTTHPYSGSTAGSGTSVAAPHVAGVAALYREAAPTASPATIANFLTSQATQNVITGNPAGTPNRLLWKGAL
jgi:subtilisin family serine protease